jgi:hypothetical protein
VFDEKIECKSESVMKGYIKYISGITFRFIKPQTRWVPLACVNFTPWRKLGTLLEFANTKIPERGAEMKKVLRDICNIPRMSTFAIGAIINEGVSRMGAGKAFVNVGVWHGFTLLSGIASNGEKRCIGVDDYSQYGSPLAAFRERFEARSNANHEFYAMDCMEYFSAVHTGEIGFYLYDGHHGYENQLRALKAAEPFFAEDCIIFIDDTNYEEVRKGVKDFVLSSPYHYRILIDITTSCNYHPTFWNGFMIIQRIA